MLTGTRDWPLRLPKRGTARLQQTSANRHERLASENCRREDGQTATVSANRHERLASETAEERTARLQQMSANRHERLASEIAEERDLEVRLQYYSDRHRELQVVQSQLPLFEQRSVRTKMLRFHAHMASLDSPQCSTCSERFPGLRLCSQSTECLRCSRDKHSPKVYSAFNNMDPGPIPPQLQVGSFVC